MKVKSYAIPTEYPLTTALIDLQINGKGYEIGFVSFRNECILSVYDDRGCDVVFATHEIMLPDFQKYIYIYTIFENPQIFFEIY